MHYFNAVLIIGVAFFLFYYVIYKRMPSFRFGFYLPCMLAVDIISLTVFYQFKITDNKTGFYYQNSFGKCKRYEYTEVSCFSIGRTYTFYLQDGKR